MDEGLQTIVAETLHAGILTLAKTLGAILKRNLIAAGRSCREVCRATAVALSQSYHKIADYNGLRHYQTIFSLYLYITSKMKSVMNNTKKRLIAESIAMLLAYGAATAAIIYYVNGWSVDKWNTITWAMFMALGIRQCYLWLQKKLEGQSDEDN